MSTPVKKKQIDPSTYGPWALVVGGSEGVGAEIALRLADAGVSSVLVARRSGPLEETAEAVRARGVECRVLSVDLTGPGPRIVREGAVTAERVGEVLGVDPAVLRG